jgi:hypothetical protein
LDFYNWLTQMIREHGINHLRLKAAKKLGMTEVPVVIADDLSETQSISFDRQSICKLG